MIALSIISFPACERNFSFQPQIRSQILPLIEEKAFTFDLPTKARRPKYFSYLYVEETPADTKIRDLVTAGVFLLKNTNVFSLFNFWLDALS
jgi:hypothetical protein